MAGVQRILQVHFLLVGQHLHGIILCQQEKFVCLSMKKYDELFARGSLFKEFIQLITHFQNEFDFFIHMHLVALYYFLSLSYKIRGYELAFETISFSNTTQYVGTLPNTLKSQSSLSISPFQCFIIAKSVMLCRTYICRTYTL